MEEPPRMGPPNFTPQRPGMEPGMGPGRRPGMRPEMGPEMGPGIGPEIGQPPRTAPPGFIPEAPGMERGPRGRRPMEQKPFFEGPIIIGPPFRPDRFRDFRRCLNHFTFIWLVNGNSFWFFPTFFDGRFVYGFRWRRNHWDYDRINVNRIAFFRCF